ncbi:hypothetical protein K466DRAFT_587194 [Polyporus arcularius HHB13444]|uniref:TFIIS N-terminal domain-containing protein n=1 Tax=Polyporus arcularius HHB13444 TaxID=1314778 RepID=A0A5C3PKJ7_9APHY|nr:hypothetical protein K466DRAFT_587194 [Polyporus arcularius HHB13444]
MGPHLPKPQLEAQVQVVPSPLPHQGASLPIPPLPPRPKRPETLAHKVAWGWVDTIIKFLQVNRDRAKESPTVAQLAFKAMVTAVTELEEQKNLISFDVITSTGLYKVVKALASADVRARKARPSEQAAGVVECWEGRFPGWLSDGDSEGGMEVDR